MIGKTEERRGLYQINQLESPTESRLFFQTMLASVSESELMLLHQRLGHPSLEYLKFLYPDLSRNKLQNFNCEDCILAKQTKSSHPKHAYKPSKPFHLIHSDIWGPTRISNITNTRWFITFIDDHTRMCWVFLMKEKFETYLEFKRFHQMVLNVFQTPIHVLRTDNGQEYFSNESN